MIKPLQSITLTNDNGEDTTYVVASAPAIVETTESADVASFSDGAEGIPVTSLIADINPVQNLNGQSAPYPAGGGKNQFNATVQNSTYENVTFTDLGHNHIKFNGTASGNKDVYIGTDYIPLADGTYIMSGISGGSSTTYRMYAAIKNVSTNAVRYVGLDDGSTTITLSNESVNLFVRVYSGAVINNVVITPMICLSTAPNPTVFAPYSNICPITGWTGMNVVRNGFNQWDEEWEVGSINPSTGNTANSANDIRSKNFIPVLPNTQYYIKIPGTVIVDIYDKDKNFLTYVRYGTGNAVINTTKNGMDGHYIKFGTYNGSYETTYNHDISINYPATDTDYHAYNGTTCPISWADEAGTVYGGTLDVTTGLLTVTHECIDLDTVATWSTYTASGFNIHRVRFQALRVTGQIQDYFTSHFPKVNAVVANRVWNISGNYYNLEFILNADTTQAQWTQYLTDQKTNGTPVQLYLPLETPVTYQLTPQAVTTILGQNNIWSDTGDVEVDYCADTKMYIAKVIAEL